MPKRNKNPPSLKGFILDSCSDDIELWTMTVGPKMRVKKRGRCVFKIETPNSTRICGKIFNRYANAQRHKKIHQFSKHADEHIIDISCYEEFSPNIEMFENYENQKPLYAQSYSNDFDFYTFDLFELNDIQSLDFDQLINEIFYREIL